jgi:hypothetical protein
MSDRNANSITQSVEEEYRRLVILESLQQTSLGKGIDSSDRSMRGRLTALPAPIFGKVAELVDASYVAEG